MDIGSPWVDAPSNPLQGNPAPQNPAMGQQPLPEERAGLASRWQDWMGRPENRAALLQFGLQMLQPVGAGQSQAGAIGQSIGAGAEAQQANIEQQIGRAATGEELGLKARQVGAQEETARAATTRANREPTAFTITPYQRARLNADDQKAFQTWLTKTKFAGDFDGSKQAAALADPEQSKALVQEFKQQKDMLAGQAGDTPIGGGGEPPVPGARYLDTAKPGFPVGWYVQQNGKTFRVE